MKSQPRVLLISNSTLHGRGYLDHAETEIRRCLGSAKTVLFFPFALFDRDSYVSKAELRFASMGYTMKSAHAVGDAANAIAETDAIFVGGGNTFRLLKTLQGLELIDAIRRRVQEGAVYIGSSAGSNVAGPTIKTTKDMPIVEPQSFDAIGLVPFQISPHYQDPDPSSTHMGETQEERILQFLEENSTPVAAMREGAWITLENGRAVLGGSNGARIYRRGHSPVEMVRGDDLSGLLGLANAC